VFVLAACTKIWPFVISASPHEMEAFYCATAIISYNYWTAASA